MKNSKVVIVDDEPLAIDVIAKYLHGNSSFELVGRFTKAKEAIAGVIKLKPDLVFLDVKMPLADGFEVLEEIMKAYRPYVIFTTAFDQYAIRAFEVNAVGYLLKPIDREKFNLALDRYLALWRSEKMEDYFTGMKNLLGNSGAPGKLERVMVNSSKSIQFIEVKDVLYFESAGDYVKAVTAGMEKTINYTMNKLEQELPADLFQRIHRSHIVNVKTIREFEPHFNGEYVIVLQNGTRLKMSRTYKDNLSQIFKGI